MKIYRTASIALACAGLFAVFALNACGGLLAYDAENCGILVRIQDVGEKTLLPSLQMEAARYELTCTLDEKIVTRAIASEDRSSGPVYLQAGTWALLVKAFNASDIQVGSGQVSVVVAPGAFSEVAVAVFPLTGTGSLVLSGTVEAESTDADACRAELIPVAGGSAVTFDLALNPMGSALSGQKSDIPAGYYQLQLVLLKAEAEILRSAPDAVRIAAGNPTNGVFGLRYDILAGKTVLAFQDGYLPPVTLSLSGPGAVVAQGTPLSVTATLGPNPDIPINDYRWYINKTLVTGTTWEALDLGSALTPGRYRVDLVVYAEAGIGTDSLVFDIAANVNYLENFSSMSSLTTAGWLLGQYNTGTVAVTEDPTSSGRGKVLKIVDTITSNRDPGAVVYSPTISELLMANLTTNRSIVTLSLDFYLPGTSGRWFMLAKTHAEAFVLNDPAMSFAAYCYYNTPRWSYASIARDIWYKLKIVFNGTTSGKFDTYLYHSGTLVDSFQNFTFNTDMGYESSHLGAAGAGDGRLMFGSWFSDTSTPDNSYGQAYIDNIMVQSGAY